MAKSTELLKAVETNEEIKGQMKELANKRVELVDIANKIIKEIERLVIMGGDQDSIADLPLVKGSIIEFIMTEVYEDLNDGL